MALPPKERTNNANMIDIAGGLNRPESLNWEEAKKKIPTVQMAISTPRLNTMNLDKIGCPNKEMATGKAK